MSSASNMNTMLEDIYKRYVAIRQNDFSKHFNVFSAVFMKLHDIMKDVDDYYGRYSGRIQPAGSHFDNLRIKKPDEFDMDIVISGPLDFERDILIFPQKSGFVELKAGDQFKNLPKRQDFHINRVAYAWLDEDDYILRSKFSYWFKSVVAKALNKFESYQGLPYLKIDGVNYYIHKSESGPASTLKIRSEGGFKVDVDLVPALRFSEARWPVDHTYRAIPNRCRKGYWLVVPKPNRQGNKERSWRIALQEQERQLMHNLYNLKKAHRLIKKFRDAQSMNIPSFYIKTDFYHEILKIDSDSYWQTKNPAAIFKQMMCRLHSAFEKQSIPLLWNENNNLLEDYCKDTLFNYAQRIKKCIKALDDNDCQQVAKYLLTPEEYAEFSRCYGI